MFEVNWADGRKFLWFKLVASGLGFVAFLVIIPLGISHFYKHFAVQQWSETTMTVVSATEGNGNKVDIQYEFEVDDILVSGEDIVEYMIPTEVKNIKQTYAPGTEHLVFYDAAAPADSNTLRPTSKFWGLFLAVIAGFVILISCAVSFYNHYCALFRYRRQFKVGA